jgi:hypothetical protein
VIKSRAMGLEEHDTTYRKIRNAFKILIRKSKGKEDHMKNKGVDGRWVLNIWGVRMHLVQNVVL